MLESDHKVLMQLLCRGNEHEKSIAIEKLFEQFSESLFAYIMHFTNHDTQLSEDFLQDVFIKIYEKAHQFNIEQDLKPWLFRIASNHCKNAFKRKNTEQKYIQNQDPDSFYIKESDHLNVNEIIKQLEWKFKEVMVLKYKFNLSTIEISQVIGIPQGTVKSRLFYATKKMAEQIDEK